MSGFWKLQEKILQASRCHQCIFLLTIKAEATPIHCTTRLENNSQAISVIFSLLKQSMASSLALKRLLSSSRSLRPAASSRRFFNTNAVREYDHDDRDADINRRPDRRVFSPFGLADILSPFPTRSSLSQILNVMDQMMESPVSGGGRRSWDARETEEGLQLRVDMPGLGKEDVKVSVEQNTLIIRGEGKKESEEDESGRRYTSRIDLPEKLYKTDEIKAEMKNGVLKVFVPRIKEDQRNDVFHVNIE